jgi:hypothetical protein
MQRNDDDRLEDHYTRLGTRTPRCRIVGCTETDPRALVGIHPNIICYAHHRLTRARSTVEAHHLAGHHNQEAAVAIPGNDHRILSDLQQSWPRATLRNPDRSPLLGAAAALRGWLDILRLCIERTIGWIPAFLERLDGWLRDQLGDRWWKDFPEVSGDAA